MSDALIMRRGGGSAGLTFKVVGGTTQPTSASENTLWIKTSANITGWQFSATAPSSVEGMVWIKTGTSSVAAFNAIKKNGLWLYPSACQQYISGTWTVLDAYAYQGGAWKQFSTAEYWLFKNGDLGMSGGFTEDTSSGNFTVGSTLKYICKQYMYNTGYHSNNAIDVTNLNQLKIVGNGRNAYASTIYFRAGMGSSPRSLDAYTQVNDATGTYTVDISGLTGLKYFVVYYQCDGQATQTTSNIQSIQLLP